MATIDDLIAQIEDKALRERLRMEMNRITKEKKFGLVFENHLPELSPIYSAKVRRHSKVALRDGPLADLWRVLSMNDGVAHCRNIGSGETREIPVDDLVVVRQFGEPIFPALVPVDKVQNGPDDAPWHTLIEADNYHALQLLEYLYSGKVDCIYIDPPYNSGARDWKYNNDYVDANDAWRHSKWLAMMQRRLKLAKRLLNPKDSVLIVTIDEKECLRLGLLLEQMFPEARLQMVSTVISQRGVARDGAVSRVEEYLFLLQFGNCRFTLLDHDLLGAVTTEKSKQLWFQFRRNGAGSLRSDSPNLFYPLIVDPTNHRIVDVGMPLPLEQDRNKFVPPAGCIAVWPLRKDGTEARWRTGREIAKRNVERGYIRVGSMKKETGVWSVLAINEGGVQAIESGEIPVLGRDDSGAVQLGEIKQSSFLPKSVWNHPSHDAGWHGSRLLSSLLPGRRFPYPKSLYAVEDVLALSAKNKSQAIVLDFFAGSGTTAHAVMRLNRQDGGRRQCISVTNNEVAADEQQVLSKQGLHPGYSEWEMQGICQYITMPRLTAAITGITPEDQAIKGDYKFNDEFPMAEGFPANLEYFRLDFLDKDHVTLGRQFREILPILWLRAGAIGPRPELPKNKPIPAMVIPEHNPFAVLVEETHFADFATGLESRDDLTHAYLVTDSEEAFQEMAGQLKVPNVIQLYRDYLENFVINKAEGAS